MNPHPARSGMATAVLARGDLRGRARRFDLGGVPLYRRKQPGYLQLPNQFARDRSCADRACAPWSYGSIRALRRHIPVSASPTEIPGAGRPGQLGDRGCGVFVPGRLLYCLRECVRLMHAAMRQDLTYLPLLRRLAETAAHRTALAGVRSGGLPAVADAAARDYPRLSRTLRPERSVPSAAAFAAMALVSTRTERAAKTSAEPSIGAAPP